MDLKNEKQAKVDMSGLTEEHIRIFLQTFADIGAEKFAPNIEVIAKVKKGGNQPK